MKRLRIFCSALTVMCFIGTLANPILSVSAKTTVTNVAPIKTVTKEIADNYKVGQVYHGFKLIEDGQLKDYNAVGRIFEHVKSGARLVQFKNTDPNKYFAVTFRTPTDDNTGKPHILEHSLLMGGSNKYPIKQLLTYFLNGSLANEMNGYTQADRTFYPFATVNEQEFNNLMDVYLDMVYNPRVQSLENIFKEEAWHHEITDSKSPIEDTGVVLNEMKGASSSPEQQLITAINRSLLPNTTYNFNSGGDPKHITDLSYKELVDYYKKYYNPSNSFIFIYGDTPLDDKLKHIDESFLSKATKKPIDSKIVKQNSFTERKYSETEYGIPKEQPADNKDYLALNFVTDNSSDLEQLVGTNLFTSLVLNNENSILRKNLRDAGFKNISAFSLPGQAQSITTILASNTDRKQKELFEKTVMNSLKEMLKQGIDKDLLASTLSSFDLSEKLGKSYTKDTGKSLYGLASMGFAYDTNMLAPFKSNDAFMEKFKNASKTHYFEKLIEDKFVNNKFTSLVTFKAVPGLNVKEKEAEVKKLADYKSSLSKESLNALIKSNVELKKWQSTPESPEVLAKIPLINVDTLTPKVTKTPLEIKRVNGVKMLFHPMSTNGTNNLSLYFDTTSVKQNQIPYIKLLSSLLGSMDTKTHTQDELTKLSAKYTNGLSTSAYAAPSINHKNTYTPTLQVSATSLNENAPNVTKLMLEVIKDTKINDKEKLKLIIDNTKANLDSSIANDPLKLALNKNSSNNSAYSAYMNNLAGIKYYNFISDLSKNFDKKYDELVKNLTEVSKTIFNKNNLTLSVTVEDNEFSKFQTNLTNIISNLPSDKLTTQNYKFNFSDKKEAYTIESPINYNIQSFNYKDLGYNVKGSLQVLSPLVNSFLWDTLRVKGGAYGAYLSADETGEMTIFTYRDPRIKESFQDIKTIPQFLENADKISPMQLNQYKLDALKSYYIPNSIYEKASESDMLYFSGVSDDYRQNCIDEILNTTSDDLKSYSEIFQDGLKENKITTIGNSKAIEANKELFDSIEPIVK
ncbi:insulinase family protein [Clostridium estertheticum]|uniref:insulinase family protein n=1 Tax=Clostridium estertheticum TaxID=238834 RepID=UPI001CF189B5|nr:insulinase family protein [Clostridium estertheticum]MCB2309460.1 insulinase family protein [Clostridium estertheticum]MCB2347906.1 insulinase family protein [Clostridium estertheticum]MCB2352412.1 insulinase family protein [Clostridium estertheticum]WAG46932.1 insulinase family protein [Clostridium estertheticum]